MANEHAETGTTMIADGDEGTQKARAVARRPTIRPRPVTPPRSSAVTETSQVASMASVASVASVETTPRRLPPVRIPAPRRPPVLDPGGEQRAAERPVLLLVADASDQFDLALRHERASAGTLGAAVASPRAMPTSFLVAAAIAASILVVTVAAIVTSRLTDAPAFTPMPPTRTIATPAPPATLATPATPAIPLVDVKSLPSAPPSR